MAIYMVSYWPLSLGLILTCPQTYCVNQGTAIKVLRSMRDKNQELESHLQV